MRKQRSKNGHALPSMLPGISVIQTKDTTLFHPKFSPLQSVIVEDLPNPVLKRRDTTAPLTHPLEVSKKHHLDTESGLVKLWRNTSIMCVLSSNGCKKMTCWGDDFWCILCILIFIFYTILYIDRNLKKSRISNMVMPPNFSLDLFKMISCCFFPRVTTYPMQPWLLDMSWLLSHRTTGFSSKQLEKRDIRLK